MKQNTFPNRNGTHETSPFLSSNYSPLHNQNYNGGGPMYTPNMTPIALPYPAIPHSQYSTMNSQYNQTPLMNHSPQMNSTAPMMNRSPQMNSTDPMMNRSPQMNSTAPLMNRSPQMNSTAPMMNRSPQMNSTTPLLFPYQNGGGITMNSNYYDYNNYNNYNNYNSTNEFIVTEENNGPMSFSVEHNNYNINDSNYVNYSKKIE